MNSLFAGNFRAIGVVLRIFSVSPPFLALVLAVFAGCATPSVKEPQRLGEMDVLFRRCEEELDALEIDSEGRGELRESLGIALSSSGDGFAAWALRKESSRRVAAVAWFVLPGLEFHRFPKTAALLLASPDIDWPSREVARRSRGHQASLAEVKERSRASNATRAAHGETGRLR